jgi:cyclic pyranopterin phosphate synthase
MPEEGLAWLDRSELLSYEEQARIARICVERFGFEGIRITGGEPTVRHELPRLFELLAPLGVDLAMTTNGVKLPELVTKLRAAGLRRVNVSLDTLRRETFLALTRRDEIERIARVAVDLGVDEIRLTGGEPTLRPDLPELVARLSQLPLRSLSLTTNGFLLRSMARPLAEAGLKRINVSLDTLQHDRFHQIARRHGLDEVLAGLEELEKYTSIAPIKVNVVAMRDFTEDEVVAFAQLARRKPYVIRFIEFMPLDAPGEWQRDQVVPAQEILERIDAVFPLRATSPDHVEPAERFVFEDGIGDVGVIASVTEPFCESCDRVRVTAEGKFRTCLFALDETDLRAVMRDGGSDAELADAIAAAVGTKWAGHHIGAVDFVRPARSMSQIGG